MIQDHEVHQDANNRHARHGKGKELSCSSFEEMSNTYLMLASFIDGQLREVHLLYGLSHECQSLVAIAVAIR